MPSRRTSNARVNTGSNSQMLHNPPLNGPLYSPPASALPLSYPPLHLLQPPPAPRLRSVPLPHPTAAAPFTPARTPAPAAFPIDLTHDTDFGALAQVIPNYTVPSQTDIYILPTARDRSLFQINTGNTPMTAVSIIHRLHALIRAPLSLQLYRSELPPDVKQAVYNYFLLQSGPNGSRIWEAFLREYTQPEGPTGAVLLQGHLHVWGLLQDHHSRWILSVDVPHTPRFHN